MWSIFCCDKLRKSKVYRVQPAEGFIFAELNLLKSCPCCKLMSLELFTVDLNNQSNKIKFKGNRAKKFFDKISKLIMYRIYNVSPTAKSSNFYLYYNEFGTKKRCYSNFTKLKMGLFPDIYDNLPYSSLNVQQEDVF